MSEERANGATNGHANGRLNGNGVHGIPSVSDPTWTSAGPDLRVASSPRRPSTRPLNLDRLPPHSDECERGLLGCQLVDPSLVSEVVKELGSEAVSAYYDLRHQAIQKLLVRMTDAMQTIDLVTVVQALKDDKLLDQIGGFAYLSQLQDDVPSAANWPSYLERVKEKWLLRKLIQTCSGIVSRIYDFEGEVDHLLDEVEQEVLALRPQQRDECSTEQLGARALGYIEDLHNRSDGLVGLPTGFVDLDRITGGFCGGELVVPAAKPSIGKSAFAMNVAVHNALAGRRVLFYTLEMSTLKLMVRAICSESKVDLNDVRWKRVDFAQFEEMRAAASRIVATRLVFRKASGMTLGQIRADARRERQRAGLDLVVVDYLQRVRPGNKESREQQVAEISAGLKEMAMELDVPVIAPAQLNKQNELRESAAIGQDADWHFKLENADGQRDPRVQPVNVFVEKGRDGLAGESVLLTFLKTYTRFESASRVQEPEA